MGFKKIGITIKEEDSPALNISLKNLGCETVGDLVKLVINGGIEFVDILADSISRKILESIPHLEMRRVGLQH